MMLVNWNQESCWLSIVFRKINVLNNESEHFTSDANQLSVNFGFSVLLTGPSEFNQRVPLKINQSLLD